MKKDEFKSSGTIGSADVAGLVKNSKETTLDRFRLMLIGPPGEGKTTTALTASEKAPDGMVGNEEWRDLDDLFVVLYDNGGLDTAHDFKLNVPHVDLSNEKAGTIGNLEKKILKMVAKRVEEGQTKTVIFSSLSTRDKIVLSNLQEQYEKFALYNALLANHTQFFNTVRQLPCNVIFEVHGKAVNIIEGDKDGGAAAEAARKTLQAQGLKEGDIKMDITGQAANFYRANMSLILPVASEGPKGKKEYYVYPHGTRNFESKTRFRNLDAKEPAHLQRLFRKIRGE